MLRSKANLGLYKISKNYDQVELSVTQGYFNVRRQINEKQYINILKYKNHNMEKFNKIQNAFIQKLYSTLGMEEQFLNLINFI